MPSQKTTCIGVDTQPDMNVTNYEDQVNIPQQRRQIVGRISYTTYHTTGRRRKDVDDRSVVSVVTRIYDSFNREWIWSSKVRTIQIEDH